MTTSLNNKAVLILGMHRSGTSVLTRLCNLLGMELGEHLLAAEKDNNDRGFWEHEDILDVHNAILSALDSSWYDIRPLPENWWKREDIQPYKKQLKDIIIRDFTDSPLWGVKDPRLCRMLPLWHDLLDELNVIPHYIHVIRHPDEVAGSLQKRDYLMPQHSWLLWAHYVLDAEYYTRDRPRSIMFYPELMQNWQTNLKDTAQIFDMKWPNTPASIKEQVANFIDPNLRHNRHDDLAPDMLEWTATPFTLLRQAKNADLQDNAFHRHMDEIRTNLHNQTQLLELVQPISHSLRETSFTYEDQVRALELEMQSLQHEHMNKIQQLRSLEAEFNRSQRIIAQYQHTLNLLYNSTSWKISAPLRYMKKIWAVRHKLLNPKTCLSTIKRGIYLWRTHGGSYVPTAEADTSTHYGEWLQQFCHLTDEDKQLLRERVTAWEHTPLISVVMPVYNAPEDCLREALDSVLEQVYPHWELCIADDASTESYIRNVLEEYQAKDKRINVVYRKKNGHISACSNTALGAASGEFIALMDQDDALVPEALYCVAQEINAHPDANIIYSDEDKMSAEGVRFGPHFKTDWNPDLLYTMNYISHLGTYRRSLLEEIGGFREGYEGSQDFDLCLRAIQLCEEHTIHHIPRVLYHWRVIPGSTAESLDNKSYAVEASIKALRDYFDTHNPGVTIKHGKLPNTFRIVWPLPDQVPSVDIIIPTRNGYRLIKRCIESIRSSTDYANYSITIIDNQSDDATTLDYLDTLQNDNVIRILRYDAPFNYSAMNNMAANQSSADILLFLNNDTEITNKSWMNEMVSHAIRPEVGAVGASLYYPNNTLQHGGIALGVGPAGIAGYLFQHLPEEDPGYYGRAIVANAVTAVTAACMAIERKKFLEVEGFNDEELAVAYNDVDLCLRLREQNYRIMWTPYARIIHYESATRGQDIEDDGKQKRLNKEAFYMQKKWKAALASDAYYNPNLENATCSFALSFPPDVPPITSEIYGGFCKKLPSDPSTKDRICAA